VTGYRIYRNGTQIATATTTSYSNTGLTASTTYSYTISSYDSAGNTSAQTASAFATTQAAVQSSLSGATVYEDGEDGTTKGWYVYDSDPAGATVTNIYDSELMSQVIQLTGGGTSNGYWLKKDDMTEWNNTTQFTLEWKMKFTQGFFVYVDVETTAGHRYLYYTADAYNAFGSGEYVHSGLGTGIIDGKWHTLVRDLQADLQTAQPGVTLLRVNGFLSVVAEEWMILSSTAVLPYTRTEKTGQPRGGTYMTMILRVQTLRTSTTLTA